MAEQNPDELIVIKHAKVTTKGTCTRRQLADVYAERGWSEASKADPVAVNDAAVTPEA